MSLSGKKARADKRRVLREFACISCGESNPILIDWHHIDPSTKRGNILATNFLDQSTHVWFEETLKCVPLCAHCHRKVHAGHLSLLPAWHPKRPLPASWRYKVIEVDDA